MRVGGPGALGRGREEVSERLSLGTATGFHLIRSGESAKEGKSLTLRWGTRVNFHHGCGAHSFGASAQIGENRRSRDGIFSCVPIYSSAAASHGTWPVGERFGFPRHQRLRCLLRGIQTMSKAGFSDDVALAQEVCRGLAEGDRCAIEPLFVRYNRFFFNFARVRLYNPEDAEDVVEDYWEELMSGQAICAYAFGGDNRASLRTYLTTTLSFRIIDSNRASERTRRLITTPHSEDSDDQNAGANPIEDLADNAPSPEERTAAKQGMEKVVAALLELGETHQRGARVIWLYINGLSYREMAQVLAGEWEKDLGSPAQAEDTLRHTFMRCKARFQAILDRQGLALEDLREALRHFHGDEFCHVRLRRLDS